MSHNPAFYIYGPIYESIYALKLNLVRNMKITCSGVEFHMTKYPRKIQLGALNLICMCVCVCDLGTSSFFASLDGYHRWIAIKSGSFFVHLIFRINSARQIVRNGCTYTTYMSVASLQFQLNFNDS